MSARGYLCVVSLTIAAIVGCYVPARSSTYVVYIPLDSPIYEELDTLNSLGYLDSYLDEIKPISRVEAARLVLEAQANVSEGEKPDSLARGIIRGLQDQLRLETGWLEDNSEDNPPTMFQPVDRLEAQYIYSRGGQRFWESTAAGAMLQAREGTPLMPDNDGIPTGAGSNEVMRWSSWTGLGGFLTGYGEAAVTGPITHSQPDASRFRALDAEAVASLGNWAVSFGQEEMRWGVGHFAALSQGDNASPLPGLRIQTVHPSLLSGFLRYLGQTRFQFFFSQLDGERIFAHPWIDGEIVCFKPLPNFEFGFTHAIEFGGRGNDHYSSSGAIFRAIGVNTGNAAQGNTNSRAGVFLKYRLPRLRGLVAYQEILGEDNLTGEVPVIGRVLPFLAVSYQGGFYLPRLTEDGRTDVRFEYAILEPNYSVHSDSLYWTYQNNLIGDPMGPNASEVDLQLGRWFRNRTKGSADLFFTERAPSLGSHLQYPPAIYGRDLFKERSVGVALDLLAIPRNLRMRGGALAFGRGHFSVEYVEHMNYGPPSSVRAVAVLSIGIKPKWEGLVWK